MHDKNINNLPMVRSTTQPEAESSSLPNQLKVYASAQPLSVPLGLPNQIASYATAPTDRGDEVQDRFRYQWAIGALLLADGLVGKRQLAAIWCEHHDDYLLEQSSGNYVAVQVKTKGDENANWRVTDEAFVKSIQRFCELEVNHGNKVDSYEFCSNVPVYVPGSTATKAQSLAASPMRLYEACAKAAVNNLGSSDFPMGNPSRIQVKSATVEIDGDLEMVTVPESTGTFLYSCNL